MTERRIVVVTAGLRVPSTTRALADALAEAVAAEMQGRGETAVISTIEIRDHGHELVDALVHGVQSGPLAHALDLARRADALIVVSPTMSAGISGMFKMFFDVLEVGALAGKPVILAASGGSQRHALVLDHGLRPLFSHLRAHPVATGVFAAPADLGDEDRMGLQQRIRRAARELAAQLASRRVMDEAAPLTELVAR